MSSDGPSDYPRWFRTLKGEPRFKGVMAFDIEGIGGPDGFLCGSLVGDYCYNFFVDKNQMWEAILDYGRDGYWIFSFNLQYDLPILEGGAYPTGDLLFTNYSLLWANYNYKRQKVRLLDAKNLFPRHNVRMLGGMVGVPKLEVQPELMSRIVKGTPWTHFNQGDQEKLEKYCSRDAEIVFLAVSLLQETLLSMGGQLKPTIAGCAMDLYRRVFHKWPWKVIPPTVNKVARNGYYGGRTENFAMGPVPDCNMYDVTSLYPSVMGSIKFPHPNHIEIDLKPKITGDWLKWEGIVHCKVKSPFVFTPLLPYRYDHRVFYPYGEMSGAWPICEIRRAIDYGLDLRSIDWVMGAKVTFNPFVDFIEALFSLRLDYLTEGKAQANVIKLLLNSLYGRFGIRAEGGLSKLHLIDQEDDFEDYKGFTTHVINDMVYAYGPVDGLGYPDYSNCFFAAQITAGGRLHMLEEFARQGENLVYCDTDSIITTGEVQTGPDLGQWRLQMKNGVADLLGPKEYSLHNEVLGSKYFAKGVPKDVAESYIKTGAARFYKALGIREALHTGGYPSQWVQTYRTHQQIVPKRYPLLKPNQSKDEWVVTHPYLTSHLQGVVSGAQRERDFDFFGDFQAYLLRGDPVPLRLI